MGRPYFLLDLSQYPNGRVVQLVYNLMDLDFDRVRNSRHWQVARPSFEGEPKVVLADIRYKGDDANHDKIVDAVRDGFATVGLYRPENEIQPNNPLITIPPTCEHCGHAPCGCGG